MRLSARTLGACALSLLAALATPASAQHAARLTPRLNALSTQPINIIVGFYNLEYERAIGPTTSLGVQATVANDIFSGAFDDSGERYRSAEAKLRYYPNGRVFTGFSVGATLGVSRFSSKPRDSCYFDLFTGCNDPSLERVSATGAKLGFELDYGWLLGADEAFIVAVGLGAKRLIIDDKRTSDGVYTVDYPEAYPTARLAIGYAW